MLYGTSSPISWTSHGIEGLPHPPHVQLGTSDLKMMGPPPPHSTIFKDAGSVVSPTSTIWSEARPSKIFCRALVLVTRFVDKLWTIKIEDSFGSFYPITFIPYYSFESSKEKFQQNPYKRFWSWALCKYMCGIVYIISHCLQMWFITYLFLSSETIRICGIIGNNSQINPSTHCLFLHHFFDNFCPTNH